MATYNGHNEDSSGNILLSIGNGMTAKVETGTTASQAYTKGSYLFFNNRLCKATTAISSGATLAVGTNLSQTSLGAELTSHLRSSDGKEFYFDVKDGTYGYYPSASKVSSEFVPFGGTQINSYFKSSLQSTSVYTASDTQYVQAFMNADVYDGTVSLVIGGVTVAQTSGIGNRKNLRTTQAYKLSAGQTVSAGGNASIQLFVVTTGTGY